MDLKQRKDVKNYMHRIACAANTIKRAAHEFRFGEDNYLQMQEMIILIERAKVLMDTLKPQQPNGENAVQGILLDLEGTEPVAGKVIITTQGEEENED